MFLPNFNVNNMILSYRSTKGNASSRNLNNAITRLIDNPIRETYAINIYIINKTLRYKHVVVIKRGI